MTTKEKFTEAKILKLAPHEKEYLISDADCSSLRVRVSPKGQKSFFVQFKHNGKQIKHKLGKVEDIPLAKARDMAMDIKCRVKAGESLAGYGKNEDRGPNGAQIATVRELFAKYNKEHVQRLRAPSMKVYLRYGGWMVENFGDYPLDFSLASAKSVVSRYADGKQVTFNRFLATVRSAWNFAMKEGMVKENPFALIRKNKEISRDTRADGDQIQAIVESIYAEENPISRVYHLTILYTMCRRGEADKMRWADLDGKVWTKPKGNTKNGKAQRVFVVQDVLDELAKLPNNGKNELVFQNFQGWTRAWRRIITRAGLPYPSVRVHDLRRSMAVWLLTTGKATVQEISFLLGHSSVAITQRVYAAYLGDNRKATTAIGETFKRPEAHLP
jgi:integrase